MLIRQSLAPSAVGVTIGVLLAALLARVLASLLFGVTTRDPLVFASVPILLLAVTVLAAWLPSGRAAKIDPTSALRQE